MENSVDGTCTHSCGKLRNRCGENKYKGCNRSMRKSIEQDHVICLRGALDKGKNPNKVYEDIWDEVPLKIAIDEKNTEMMKILIEYGANVNGVPTGECESIPLYGANYDCSKLLLESGANPNIEDEKGWTPLFSAVNRGDIDVVKLLLENGANINHIDKNGDGIFDIWSNDEMKAFLRKYISDEEELKIKQVDV